MKITYSKNLFLCQCSFEERHIPKAAHFRWEASKKLWFTDRPEQVATLRQYCDEKAKNKIDSTVITHTEWTGDLRVPEELSLFPFQERAIRFALSRNRSYLGLDPGLGKTICAAVIANTLANGKEGVLYICPPFLVETVREEFRKWGVGCTLIALPDSQINKFADANVWHPSRILIVDEAHRFKTRTAQRTKCLFEKYVPYFEKVVFMSGTPMPNRPIELFPVLSNAAPECIDYMNQFEYARKYCAAHKGPFGWDFSGASNMKDLSEKVVGKFMIRMKKKDVLPELPPKTESMVFLQGGLTTEIEGMDRALLKEFSPEDLMKGIAANGHIATYRRELGLIKVKGAVEFINNILDDTDEPILIFAIHKEVVANLALALSKDVPLVITGDTPMADRHEIVGKFQEGNSRLLIGNIQAMGTGFTLTKATRVVFVEFSWTPADNEQASDRAHRVGQKDNVLCHYLVYKNSVDRAVLETIFAKQKVTRHI